MTEKERRCSVLTVATPRCDAVVRGDGAIQWCDGVMVLCDEVMKRCSGAMRQRDAMHRPIVLTSSAQNSHQSFPIKPSQHDLATRAHIGRLFIRPAVSVQFLTTLLLVAASAATAHVALSGKTNIPVFVIITYNIEEGRNENS